MTEFITTPTEDWLNTAIADCSDRFLVSSPYVSGWLPKLSSRLPSNVRRLVLTRTDLRDFASGASDLESLCNLAESGSSILSCNRLHAKVYVIDETCGLVTSANATFSGMRRNFECGIVIRDLEGVRTAANLVIKGFGSKETPQRWSFADLRLLREPVRRLKQSLYSSLGEVNTEERKLPDVSPSGEMGSILTECLPGWTKLALEGVQMQKSDTFDLHSFVAVCAPLVAKRYPNNQHVREKLRQQLQRLRDLGLIEFLGDAKYQRHRSDPT